ncbi:nucleotide exchange factor GrpE [soil metagenome]
MTQVEDDRDDGPQDPLDETAAAALDSEGDPQQGELEELKDLLLRKSAEFDNYRKRTERDRQALSAAITAGVIEDLLPLVDDLERALQVDAGQAALLYRQGVELIQRQLADVLRKRGVKPIESLGADFDPYYHQAVVYEPAEGRREGEIVEEFRRGYMLGDRLLRPSMVKVAKG